MATRWRSSGLPPWSARPPRADRAMQLPKRPMQKGRVAIDRELIHELADLLEETGLDEIEIEQNGMRVRVARHSPVMHLSTGPDSAAPPAAVMVPTPVPMPGPAPADPAKHPGAVTSPMVGTAYRAAEPGARSEERRVGKECRSRWSP